MPTIEGGCLCGAVRYRSDAEPVMQVVCHCETCRKNSGSAFSMNVAVPQDRLRIESGSPRRYEDHSGASGKAFYRFFCGDCGSHIYSHGPAYGAIAFIKNCPGSIFPRASPRHQRTRAEKDSNSPASSQRNPSTRLHRRPRCPRRDPRKLSERKTADSPVMARLRRADHGRTCPFIGVKWSR